MRSSALKEIEDTLPSYKKLQTLDILKERVPIIEEKIKELYVLSSDIQSHVEQTVCRDHLRPLEVDLAENCKVIFITLV